ncbi:MAG: hypothetical protein QME81_12210 [bacterium]|nr:hypothetical protein [bacterium]
MKLILKAVLLLALVFSLGNCTPTYIVQPPPEPRIEKKGPPPHPKMVWIAGHWGWKRGGYAWIPGHWAKVPKRGAAWVPGHWEKSPRGHRWVPGHWK